MVQIIQEQVNPLGQALGSGLGGLLGQLGQQNVQQRNQGNLSKALLGDEYASSQLPSDLQLKLAEMQQRQQMANQQALAKQAELDLKRNEKFDIEESKRLEKIKPLKGGLDVIKRMRELGATGKLGRGSGLRGAFGGEVAKLRSEYEQLGKSLIPLASSVSIRNKEEFKTLAEKLYDPSLLDAEREGLLIAMERIIGNSLGEKIRQDNQGQPQQTQTIQQPKGQSANSLQDFKPQEGQRAIDNETGQQFFYRNGKWVLATKYQ